MATRAQWRLTSGACVAVPVVALLSLGCDSSSGPNHGRVTVSVRGTVGVQGEWLGDIPVEFGSYGDILDPRWPSWRTIDATTTNSNGEYTLSGRMAGWLSQANVAGCTTGVVRAHFQMAPFDLVSNLPGRGGACDGVELQVNFPVRRSHVGASGTVAWADGSPAAGLRVSLRTPGEDNDWDRAVTDAQGFYSVEAQVLDVLCDPDSKLYVGTSLLVSEAGITLGFSEPLECGNQQVDLVATYPS